MKHLYRTILAGTLVLAAGCNSLDQVPTDRYTDSTFWTSIDRAQSVLNMAYNQMYAQNKIWFDECLSDNLYEMRGNPDSRQIRTGTATASLGVFESEWKWLYQGIKTTNVFMDNIDLVPDMDPEAKMDMIAQIRFIRAYLYFRAVNFYGAVPFFLSDISLDESKASTRTPKDEIIPQLISELEAIIPDLPSRDELSAAENGEITKAAAMVLLARIYLYEGDMQEVADICDELIHNQGEYGTYSLFNTATDHCSAYENLFMSVIYPLTGTWADKYAAEGNYRAVETIHIVDGIVGSLAFGALVVLGYSLGSAQVEALVNSIPAVITDGLTVATGLLPAMGFAMLAQMTVNKKVIVFFFLGFILSSYMGVPVLGIAMLGVIAAVLKTGLLDGVLTQPAVSVDGGDDDDF